MRQQSRSAWKSRPRTLALTARSVLRDVHYPFEDGEFWRHYAGAGLATSVKGVDRLERRGQRAVRVRDRYWPHSKAGRAATGGRLARARGLP